MEPPLEASPAPGAPEPEEEEFTSLAFDLLNADDPSGSSAPARDSSRTLNSLGSWRSISMSFDSDSLGADGGAPRTRKLPLLRAIHHELSQLTADADGVSEKVKVGVDIAIFFDVGRRPLEARTI